jgi:hypothetical protein
MKADHSALSINTVGLWDSGESYLLKYFQLQHFFAGIN